MRLPVLPTALRAKVRLPPLSLRKEVMSRGDATLVGSPVRRRAAYVFRSNSSLSCGPDLGERAY